MGYVSEAFDQTRFGSNAETSAIGTFVISTAGEVSLRECQPFLVTCQHGQIAVCHNATCRSRARNQEVGERSAIFSSTSDTEVILHGVARSTPRALPEAIPEVLRHTKALFDLFLTPTELIAIRDPRGFRRWRWVVWETPG